MNYFKILLISATTLWTKMVFHLYLNYASELVFFYFF